MAEIIPAIIPQNLNMVREEFGKIFGLVKKVQIDVVDGNYAPNKTWPFKDKGQLDEMRTITNGQEKFPYADDFDLEIDMFVLHPIEYLNDFVSLGAKSIVIHIDSTDHMKECLATLKNFGCQIGLGIKPSGDISLLESFLPEADFVQFMGNDKVGYSGVELDTNIFEKIKNFHHRHPSVPIQIDIGVNEETIPKLKEVGVSAFVSDSAIFNSLDIKETITKFQSF